MKTLFLISIIAFSYSTIDFIHVQKNKRLMHVFFQKKLIKTYKISLGFNPKGHKIQEGDGKTPEGSYVICSKNPKSSYFLSLKISYPNKKDILHAKQKGVSAGGDIMIHGLGKYFGWLGRYHIKKDWTLGCIAVTNEEIKEIYDQILVGTKIQIDP
jgi:murein L,D-transpeptidase YafK